MPAVAPAPGLVSRPVAETLSNRPGSRISGWYLAPTSGFTSMVGSRGYLFGMRGVLMLDQRFGIGIAGNLVGTDDTRLQDDQVRHLGGYGGLYLQYVLASNRLVHGFVDTTMGSGAWCEQSVNDDCDGQKFAFLEPTANLELNVAKHLRLAAGIGLPLRDCREIRRAFQPGLLGCGGTHQPDVRGVLIARRGVAGAVPGQGTAQVMAAFSSLRPSLVRCAIVVSAANMPRRRAGAVKSSTILLPLS